MSVNTLLQRWNHAMYMSPDTWNAAVVYQVGFHIPFCATWLSSSITPRIVALNQSQHRMHNYARGHTEGRDINGCLGTIAPQASKLLKASSGLCCVCVYTHAWFWIDILYRSFVYHMWSFVYKQLIIYKNDIESFFQWPLRFLVCIKYLGIY